MQQFLIEPVVLLLIAKLRFAGEASSKIVDEDGVRASDTAERYAQTDAVVLLRQERTESIKVTAGPNECCSGAKRHIDAVARIFRGARSGPKLISASREKRSAHCAVKSKAAAREDNGLPSQKLMFGVL